MNSSAIMDPLHLWGVEVIQNLQTTFKDYSESMLFMTSLGDPGFAFLIYFPLAFFLSQRVGIKVLWMGVIAEWLNAVLKRILFGHRPYWWVHETSLYKEAPSLDQYSLTCETGPGSPSGHAMVTSAVWYVIVRSFNASRTKNRVFWFLISWSFLAIFMLAIMVSRCFIATHFPHQVLVGTATGFLMGELHFRYFSPEKAFSSYATVSALLMGCAIFAHWFLEAVLGWDVMWSIEKAVKWCAKKEWIHLNTTVYAALTRDSSVLLGLGIALQLMKRREEARFSLRRKIGETLIGIGLAILINIIRIPESPMYLFYLLMFIKWSLLPCLLLTVVPRIGRILEPLSYMKKNS